MSTQRHRARVTAVAACAAVAAALTAGPAEGAGERPAAGGPSAFVTLVTGDRVATNGTSGPVQFLPAEGREGIPFRVQRADGATYVIPSDAERLVAEGTLDRRLFDVTELSRAPYREADGLPLIVTYDGERPAALRSADVRADLPAIDGEALTVDAGQAGALWRQLTEPADDARALTTAPGIEAIALDGIVTKSLAESVPQIGAPEAWAAGYDGEGVTIAVLDTGISSTHPDVADHVIASENFSDAADAEDHDGHGTHVASTATGTGALSDGTYTGVAPGADLLNGKVLDDEGSGWESDIVAGMQWAVAQGADIVSMSLGGTATPELDLMEEAVNTLSADSDTLFVVASGNEGPGAGTVGSPGTAEAALTVGAVDKQDVLADFSSAGPTAGDGLVKPDVTAPGVDIAAAGAEGAAIWDYGTPVTDGYVAISGTSMATPHVSGAAALLAQAHPDWDGERLKAALASSAVSTGAYTPFQQGTGRIDVPAALTQDVIAETGPLNFGVVPYPYDDTEPVTRDVTYRNLGDTDVTLDLATTSLGPDGNPAPDGMFTLAQDSVTVPAGDTATVQVTADGRLGDGSGAFGVWVTATGDDGTTVRTAGVVEREATQVQLDITATGRDGETALDWGGVLYNTSTGDGYWVYPDWDGTARLRVTPGDYVVDTTIRGWDSPEDANPASTDWIVQPRLSLTEDTSVTVDAADARPFDVRTPDPDTEATDLTVGYDLVTTAGVSWSASVGGLDAADSLGTATIGGLPGGWSADTYYTGTWGAGGAEYHSVDFRETPLYTGLDKRLRPRDLARVRTEIGSPVPDAEGMLYTMNENVWGGAAVALPVPRTVDVYVEVAAGAWQQQVEYFAADGASISFESPYREYAPRERTTETFNTGVFGPSFLSPDEGLYRGGDWLYTNFPTLRDGGGNTHSGWYDTYTTTLYRNGEEYVSTRDSLDWSSLELPADEAEYELVTTVERGGASVSSTVTSAWTFTSARTGDDEEVRLPSSAVRFSPRLALDSTAPADRAFRVPVTVEGSAAGTVPAVEVSYDSGETWTDAPVRDGKVKVTNPAAGGSVSFRATATDEDGNTSTQTIIDAYRTR
ncbi:S8 family serine peptidase [Streptomyces sp. NPDC049879]|uniref:S8 family serine peptidase n=1 Tax=Streptomyces sp. NPDC049879 TaxID=3365598 RepID=UPI0037AB4874